MLCVQFGRRVLCPNPHRHRSHALTLLRDASAQPCTCEHVGGRSQSRCGAHVFVSSLTPDVHLCVELTAAQRSWFTVAQPSSEAVLRQLGLVEWNEQTSTHGLPPGRMGPSDEA